MSNVLPPTYQKKLMRGFLTRLVLATAIVASITGIIASLSLTPSYLSLYYGAKPMSGQDGSTTASTTVIQEVMETRDLITLGNHALATSTSPVDLMRLVAALRPKDAHLDSIGYVRGISSGQILVNGTAVHVSDIESYRNALVNSGKFLQVTVPVETLAGTTNGRFSITLKSAL